MAASQNIGPLLILTFTCVCAFNIDTKIPFIRKGDINSYFGFSVAEHQITGSVGDVLENVLLVGAPKYVKNGEQIGGLFKCSFNTWCEDTCDYQIQAESDEISLIPGTRADQWFGSVVRSSGTGGYVVVCAHRYSINYSGLGKCVTLKQNLVHHQTVQPCQDDGNEQKGAAFCQAGTSADINMDGTVVMGGPGVGRWTGAVFTKMVKRQLGGNTKYFGSSWKEEDDRQLPPINLYSYMGFSVTSGHYNSNDPTKMMYVGGAPRSNETGVVILFNQDPKGYLLTQSMRILPGKESFTSFGHDLATVDLNADGYDDLVVGAPLYYERARAGGAIFVYMGSPEGITVNTVPVKITNAKENEEECKQVLCTDSRFGFSVSPAGDVNLDGYPDLVVGAPYEGGGRGAVYIYHGSEDGIVTKYAQRIFAEDIDPMIKTFGHAVGGQLDIDNNGYDDIAVGTYLEDKAYLLRTRPIIRLSANITLSPMKVNLSQPKDCDVPNEVGKKHCIELQLCMSYTARPARSFNTAQKIFYKIELEKGMSVGNERVMFVNVDPLHQRGTMKEDKTDLEQQNVKVCKKEKIKLMDKFNDKLTPISFSVSYSLAEIPFPSRDQCADGVPDINKYPVLVTGEEKVTTLLAEVNFAKECGANDICESDIDMVTGLVNLTIQKTDSDGTVVLSYGEDSEVILDIKLTNRGEPAYETKLFITTPAEFERTIVQVVMPPSASPVDNVINETLLVLSNIGNPFGNQEKSTNYRHYRVRFNTKKLAAGEERFSIIIKVNTTSEEQTRDGDIQEIKVRVINRAEVELKGSADPDGDVFFRGPARGISNMKKESDIGPAINHTYTVYNRGPGTIGKATLRIYWPFELKTRYPEGKILLYLMQDPVVLEGPAECNSYPEFVNDLDIQQQFNVKTGNQDSGPSYAVTGNRRKREVEPSTTTAPPGRKKMELSSNNIIHIDCQEKANCRVMECRISGLERQAQAKILLRARLWETTLVQEFSAVDEVWIHSEGLVILDSDLHIEQNKTDDVDQATTYALPDLGRRVAEEIKWWIILVAVLAGIIVLIIFILILWKCGFFKRLRPEGYEPTYKGDLKKTKDDAAYS